MRLPTRRALKPKGRISHRPEPRRRGERGLTMIEMIATIFLITLGVVGIAADVAATEHIATVNQDQSQLEVAIRQLSDWTRDSSPNGLTYSKCDADPQPSTYQTAVAQAVARGVLKLGGAVPRIIHVFEAATAGGSRNAVPTPPIRTCSAVNCTPVGSRCADWGVQEIRISVSDARGLPLTRTVWKSSSW